MLDYNNVLFKKYNEPGSSLGRYTTSEWSKSIMVFLIKILINEFKKHFSRL